MFINTIVNDSIIVDLQLSEKICALIYVGFLVGLSFYFFYVKRIQDRFLKVLKDKYDIQLNSSVQKFRYMIPVVLSCLIAALMFLMLMGYIDIEVYFYICFTIILAILIYIYHNLCDNLLEFLQIVSSLNEVQSIDNKVCYFYKNIIYGLSMCISYELNDQLYYHLCAMLMLYIFLIANYLLEFVNINIDPSSFVFVCFMIIENYMFCKLEIISLIYAIILISILTKYPCNINYKFGCFIFVLLVRFYILLVNQVFSDEKYEIYKLFILFLLFILLIFVIFCSYKLVVSINFHNKVFECNWYMLVIVLVLPITLIVVNMFKSGGIHLFLKSQVNLYRNMISDIFDRKFIKDAYIDDWYLASFYSYISYVKIIFMLIATLVFFVLGYYFDGIFGEISDALLYMFPAICLLLNSSVILQKLSSVIAVILFTVYIVMFLSDMNLMYLYIILGLMLINIVVFNIKSYFINKYTCEDIPYLLK